MARARIVNLVHTNPQFRKQALLYRGFANERRLFILTLLSRRPHTGNELVKIISIGPSSISKHLRVLMTAGLVYGVRYKKSVKFYAVNTIIRKHYIF